MGCCSSRNTLSREDRLISSKERKIGLSSCSPISIELSIKKWIGSEGLTLPRLKKAAEALQIDIGDFTSPDEPLVKLFKQFKTGDSFNVSELISFCVYLSNARPDEKAGIWFDIADQSLALQLTYGQVKEFISMLFRFTYKVLPILAQGDEVDCLSAENIEIYTNEAYKHQREFIENTSMKLCPEHTLDRETFLAQLNIYSKITYSDGFRQLVRESTKTP